MSQLGFAGKRSVAQRAGPHASRLGGLPSYFGHHLPRPVCTDCSTPLFMLCQVFAPTDRDRSLLLWGCNSIVCNAMQHANPSQRGSWVVQRSQSTVAYESAPTPTPDAVSSVAVSFEHDPWGASEAWGIEDKDIPPSTATIQIDPLCALATASPAPVRVHPLSASAEFNASSSAAATAHEAAHGPPPAASDALSSASDLYCFPAIDILTAVCDEDGGESTTSEASGSDHSESDLPSDEVARRWREYEQWRVLLEGEDDCSAPDTGERGATTGAPDDSDDDSPGAAQPPSSASSAGMPAGVAKAEEAQGATAGVSLSAWRTPGVEESRVAAPRKGDDRLRNKARVPVGAPLAAITSGCKSSGATDEYEDTPAALRYMMRFQDWLQRSGHPCLRYAYGLRPRWPVPRPPRASSVPSCSCGRERVFEMQILPPALNLLQVDDYTDLTVSRGTAVLPPVGEAPSSWGGMDFASVLVFSCPESCSTSETEFAFAILNQ
jgi:hypothetical protein